MPAEQQGQQDNSLEFLYTLLAIAVLLIGVWFLFRENLTKYYLYFRIGELKLIDFCLNQLAPYLGGLYDQQMEVLTTLMSAQEHVGHTVDIQYLINLTVVTCKYLRYPFMGVIILLGITLLCSKGLKQFRLIFNTNSLRKSEQYNWPQIIPVVKLDLVSKKLDDGPWAMAVSPMVFCKQKGLLDVTKELDGNYTVKLRRNAAYRELSLQLGPIWEGVHRLPPYLKALLAIFAARINADKKGAERLLDHIALSANDEITRLDFAGTDQLLNKHLNSKGVQFICARHAYVTTIMASMLEGARVIGVLASAEFIWLKPLDRRMWYMLNSVGRITAVSEICGAYAHWLAEKKLGTALVSPMVDEAVKGLEIALGEIIYKPDGES